MLWYVYENGADSSKLTNSDIHNLWYVYENGADSSNLTNYDIQKFWYVYENGADSSNEKEKQTMTFKSCDTCKRLEPILET